MGMGMGMGMAPPVAMGAAQPGIPMGGAAGNMQHVHVFHPAPTPDWQVGQRGDKKIWIHKSGQVRENEPPHLPPVRDCQSLMTQHI